MNETLRRWFLKFGRLIVGDLHRSRSRVIARWHRDEMVIEIRGRNHWLWQAVDDEGEVFDVLVQPRRCATRASEFQPARRKSNILFTLLLQSSDDQLLINGLGLSEIIANNV